MAQTTQLLVDRAAMRYGDTSHRLLSDAQWLLYMNDAYAEINAMSTEWPWLRSRATITTVSGTRGYTISGVEGYEVTAVFNNTQGYALSPIDGTGAYRDDYPDTDETGEPVSYRFHGASLELFPTPDSADSIIVDFVLSPTDLVLASGGPVWPDRFSRILVEFALSRAYTDDGNSDWASLHRDVGEKMVADMKHAFLSGRQSEHYPRVIDDWWG